MRKISNPFQKIKSRTLLYWVLLSIPGLIVMLIGIGLGVNYIKKIGIAIESINFDDPLFVAIVFQGWIYLVLLIWCCRQLAKFSLKTKYLLGRLSSFKQILIALFIVIPILLFSLGSGQLLYYFGTWVKPELIELMIEQELFLNSSQTAYPIIYNTWQVIIIVLVAPIVEEILFRGILLQRWMTKWGVVPALIVSSFVFAILHFNVIGLFVFGLIMALLYLRTRTLLVPIVAHMFNNLVAVGLEVFSSQLSQTESFYTIEQIHRTWSMGLVYMAIATPILLYFIVKNWPRPNQRLPYISNYLFASRL